MGTNKQATASRLNDNTEQLVKPQLNITRWLKFQLNDHNF
jgi:hypothetical protein